MSTIDTVSYEITHGPAAARIIDSFTYAHDNGVTLNVEFRLRPMAGTRLHGSLATFKITMTVVGVSYESATSGMFLLDLVVVDGPLYQSPTQCFYNANARAGSMTFRALAG